MPLSWREKQAAVKQGAQGAQTDQLEDFAWVVCQTRGPGARPVPESRCRQNQFRRRSVEKVLYGTANGVSAGGAGKSPIGDIDRYIAQNNNGSLSSTDQALFLVVGVAVHPDVLDAAGMKAAQLKTLKAQIRRSVGNKAPKGDQLLAIDRRDDVAVDNLLLLVVTPIHPDQGKLTYGVLLMDDESSEIPTPHIIRHEEVFYFAEYRSADTASSNRTVAWKVKVSKALKREIEALFPTATQPAQPRGFAHDPGNEAVTQLAKPQEHSLTNDSDLLAALLEKNDEIPFRRKVKEVLEEAGEEADCRPLNAAHLTRFIDHEAEFTENDMRSLLREVNDEWLDIEHVTEWRLWQLRKGIEAARAYIGWKFVRGLSAEGVYLLKKFDDSGETAVPDYGAMVLAALETAERCIGP